MHAHRHPLSRARSLGRSEQLPAETESSAGSVSSRRPSGKQRMLACGASTRDGRDQLPGDMYRDSSVYRVAKVANL